MRGPTTTTPSAGDATLGGIQKRILSVLLVSQVLSGVGLAAGVTVAALLAQEMLSSTALAGLPGAVLTVGSAVAAVAVGRYSQSRGRRQGLATGYLVGALGSAGVVAAVAIDSPVLLFASLFCYGSGVAVNLQARYAGADLAGPARRARAVSTVLVATTLGGVVGPNLVAPAGVVATAVGLPHLAGLFLFSGVAYALAAVVLLVWLRPDPLLYARALADPTREETGLDDQPSGPSARVGGRRGPFLGVLVMASAQTVMVAVMTMTPVHMHAHGHSPAAAGLVIALHVGAMYLTSPLTGLLVDRLGRIPVACASALTLAASGGLAALAPDDSVASLALALVLLGLGWNLGLVSGTAIVTDSVPLATRAKAQGAADVAIAVAGATGGMASGVVVASTSYPVLALAGGAIALALLSVITTAGRRRDGGPQPASAPAEQEETPACRR